MLSPQSKIILTDKSKPNRKGYNKGPKSVTVHTYIDTKAHEIFMIKALIDSEKQINALNTKSFNHCNITA